MKSKRLRIVLIVVFVLVAIGVATVVVIQNKQPAIATLRPTIEDIPYVSPDDSIRRLDIYLPESGDRPFPTLLMLHGNLGNKTTMNSLATHYVQKGYAIVLPSYRINPVQMNDGYCALGWTVAHAAEHHFDMRQIYLIGWSSGGGIAAELGTVKDASPYMTDCPELVPEQPWTQGVVLYAAGSDRWPEHGWRIDEPPLTWITGDEPPFFLLHGKNDSLIPPADSEQLAAALQVGDNSVELLLIADSDHTSILPGRAGGEAVIEQLDSVLERIVSGA